MLNIPDNVKALLKQDNVLKNFRVKFPDGDRADIINGQLLKESMKFEEYLASRTPIKFGLCEANVISFQCAGIENIKRKRIHVQMEIDTTSLGTGSTSPDVPFPFYAIHFGDFIVTSCERDAATGIRKVVGTSQGLTGNDEYSLALNNACWYDKQKIFYFAYSSSKTTSSFNLPSYYLLQGQNIFPWGPYDIGQISGSASISHTFGSGSGYTADYSIYDLSGSKKYLQTYIQYEGYSEMLTPESTGRPLFEVNNLAMIRHADENIWDIENFEYSIINEFKGHYKVKTMHAENVITPSNVDQFDCFCSFLHNILFSAFLEMYWYVPDRSHDPSQIYAPSGSFNPWLQERKFIPMYTYFMRNEEQVAVPKTVIFTLRERSSSSGSFTQVFTTRLDIDRLFYQIFYDDNITIMTKKLINITTEQVKIENNTRYTPALPILNINVKTSMQDNLEILGKFGGLGRDGEFREYSLLDAVRLLPRDDLYPSNSLYPSGEENTVRVETGEFISASYDEYVFYYKGIYVKYKDHNQADCEYQALFDADDDNPDMPYYDVSSNSFITSGLFTEAELITLITPLIDALKRLKYYQSDIQMRGLPYIEVGDTLFLRTRNDTIVTPTLQNIFTGIQDIRQRVVSR